MDATLETVLVGDNPWLEDRSRLRPWLKGRVPSSYVPRRALEQARRRWSDGGKAHLVIGPRQAGKSTAVWAYLAEQGKPVLFLDCEQPLVRAWLSSPPSFLADYGRLVTEPVLLFIEEAQHLEEAGLFIKGLVDRGIGVPILVTGSSSYHLGAKTRESLAGRATRSRLLPFSFTEVCQDLGSVSPLMREHQTRERFARHLAYGGYPAVWLARESEQVLTDLVEAVVLRDASDLFRITRPDAFRHLLRLVATQVGSQVNHAEWASILGIGRDTVASYLGILEESHILATLPPFAGGKRFELTGRPKMGFVDNGVRNRLLHDFKPLPERADAGPALEAWVFAELRKHLPAEATVHFWRSTSGAEVDFVVVYGDRLLGIEVKAQALIRPTLPRSARSFLEAYRPSLFLVVNTGLSHREQVEASPVRWIEPAALGGVVEEWWSLVR